MSIMSSLPKQIQRILGTSLFSIEASAENERSIATHAITCLQPKSGWHVGTKACANYRRLCVPPRRGATERHTHAVERGSA
jgi:hypothetical protein